MTSRRMAAAKKLASLHQQAEPLLTKAFVLESRSEGVDEPIKLLEVVEGAVEAGVMPIYFGANKSHGIDFASVIIELSPAEFGKYKRRRTIAVDGESWKIGEELLQRG